MAGDEPRGAVNVNAKLLGAVESLTQTITRLDNHQQNAEVAAKERHAEMQALLRMPGGGGGGARGGGATAEGYQAQLGQLNTRRDAAARATAGHDRSTPPGTTVPEPDDINNPSAGEALMFAMMGERGGPFGSLRQHQYMLQRNLGWYQGVLGSGADLARNGSTMGGIVGGIPGLSKVLDMAAPKQQMTGFSLDENGNPVVDTTLKGGVLSPFMDPNTGRLTGKGTAAAMAIGGASKAINVISGWQEMGAALGYTSGDSRGFLGFRNPLAQTGATREGARLALERQALMGRVPGMGVGSGLTKDQATSAVQTLAAQGFSDQNPIGGNFVNGDNMNIARNLLAPLMNQGLSAQDAAQWTPALRNSSTSIEQLRDTLDTLSTAARATKQSVADMNASLVEAGQIAESQGGLRGSGAETGSIFTATTGLSPTMSNTLMQNPMYQAMMIGQYGVLPSGITDLPGGAQVGGMLSLVNLMKGAFSGLNHDKYETINGKRVLMARGQSLMDSQIASTLGVPRSMVDRLVGEGGDPQRQAAILAQLGSPTEMTGLFDRKHLSGKEAMADWGSVVDGNYKALGLSKGQLSKIDAVKPKGGETRLEARYKALTAAMDQNQGNKPQNQILGTVQIAFAGQAKKLFKSSPTSIQIAANAGAGPATNGPMNSPMGDAIAAHGSYPALDIGAPTPTGL